MLLITYHLWAAAALHVELFFYFRIMKRLINKLESKYYVIKCFEFFCDNFDFFYNFNFIILLLSVLCTECAECAKPADWKPICVLCIICRICKIIRKIREFKIICCQKLIIWSMLKYSEICWRYAERCKMCVYARDMSHVVFVDPALVRSREAVDLVGLF